MVCILYISCSHCHVSVDETQRRMWYVYYTSVVATVMSLWTRHREECGMYTIHQYVATVMSLWTRHREECGMYTIHQL